MDDAKLREAMAKALRERFMGGRFTRPWESLPKSDRKKWLEHASAILRAINANKAEEI